MTFQTTETKQPTEILLTKASLRSKRFRLVSEQRKTEKWDFRFGRVRNETIGGL